MDRSDVELLKAFQDGDQLAFVSLYNRHKKGVFLYILKLLGNPVKAEDIFQETFLRVYTKRETFRTGRNVLGWIFAIARNLCLNAIRDERKVVEISEDTAQAREDDFERKEELELVHREIEKLPLDYREVLVLRDFEGLTYQEIAEITERSMSSVKVTLFRARQRLRHNLAALLR